MFECKVSIIIPVHSGIDYISKCIESAMNQTFNDIEIICVCGSGSREIDDIARSYANRDDRIVIIEDKNGSYGHKLNVGTKKSKADYIAILEGDDYYDEKMVELLYSKAVEFDLDYVDGDYKEFFEVDGKEYYYDNPKYSINNDYNILLKGYEAKKSGLLSDRTANWSALYKKDFLIDNNIMYNESPGAAFQDIGFRFLTTVLSNSTYHCSDCVYYYRQDNVQSSFRNQDKIYDIVREFDFLKDQLIQREITDDFIWENFYTWKHRCYYWNAIRLPEDIAKPFIEHYKNELMQDINNGHLEREMLLDRYKKFTWLLLENEYIFNENMKIERNNCRNYLSVLISIVKSLKGKQSVLCGCGKNGINIAKMMSDSLVCICDSAPQKIGTMVEGKKVLPYDEATRLYSDKQFFISSSKYGSEIKRKLVDLGINSENIVYF